MKNFTSVSATSVSRTMKIILCLFITNIMCSRDFVDPFGHSMGFPRRNMNRPSRLSPPSFYSSQDIPNRNFPTNPYLNPLNRNSDLYPIFPEHHNPHSDIDPIYPIHPRNDHPNRGIDPTYPNSFNPDRDIDVPGSEEIHPFSKNKPSNFKKFCSAMSGDTMLNIYNDEICEIWIAGCILNEKFCGFKDLEESSSKKDILKSNITKNSSKREIINHIQNVIKKYTIVQDLNLNLEEFSILNDDVDFHLKLYVTISEGDDQNRHKINVSNFCPSIENINFNRIDFDRISPLGRSDKLICVGDFTGWDNDENAKISKKSNRDKSDWSDWLQKDQGKESDAFNKSNQAKLELYDHLAKDQGRENELSEESNQAKPDSSNRLSTDQGLENEMVKDCSKISDNEQQPPRKTEPMKQNNDETSNVVKNVDNLLNSAN